MSYLFYDTETTGTNCCFDQIIQFAAIRTDDQLQEISRHEWLIRLNPDVIPTPGASITHRIALSSLVNGVSEYEAMQEIHALFNEPGTISIGYNTLGFDDEFMRFSFYRNLLPPYTHQYANQCGRMDLYPITLLYYLYNPDAIEWPKDDDGRISLKLENLSRTNQLATGQAHNAMVDVQATLALAKRLRQHQSMWDYLCGYFHKATDTSRLQQLPSAFTQENSVYAHALLVEGKIGGRCNFVAPVLALGAHQIYQNQTLWLRLDSEDLQKTTEETIGTHSRVIRKRAGEPPILLPPKERFAGKISSERAALVEKNLDWLKSHPAKLLEIANYHRHFEYPKIPTIDADAALYTAGFPTRSDEAIMQQFHRANVDKKIQLAKQLTDPVRQTLAMRLLARHFYESLSASDQDEFDQHRQRILQNQSPLPVDFRGKGHVTPAIALEEMALIRAEKSLDAEQNALLDELETFYQSY